MKTKNRETVGKISSDLLQKKPYSNDPIEIEKAMHGDYSKNLFDCWSDAKSKFSDSFFLVVLTKREPLMPNVLRHYFFARASCPTPDYDQAVYHYKKEEDFIDFLWVIPSRDTCIHLKENAAIVAPEEYGLLDFVFKFADGSLFALAKKLNNEEPNSQLLIK